MKVEINKVKGQPRFIEVDQDVWEIFQLEVGRPLRCINEKNEHVYFWHKTNRKQKNTYLHIWIAQRFPDRVLGTGPKIDHKDRDPKNNTCANLRRCTQSQNRMNAEATKINPALLRGVIVDTRWGGYYSARIGVGGKSIHLGMFETPEDAHAAYCEAAKEHHGEFAYKGE